MQEKDKNLNKTLSNEISNINISETIIAYSTILGMFKNFIWCIKKKSVNS